MNAEHSAGATEELTEIEPDKPTIRFNDAKCDNSGRLWAGTMPIFEGLSPPVAQCSLYSYTNGKITKQLSDITLSNGLGWSPDNKTMYYTDTHPRKVYAFDFHESEGTISNQRVLVDYGQEQSLGWPDGMCIDTEGRLWVAGYLGQHVICWEPSEGKMVTKVPIPAMRVTCCCFGGPGNDWLFVTTARHNTIERELAAFPNSGGIFLVKGLGAKGPPMHRFRYNF